MYFLLLICLAFALLLILNVAASLAASAIWRVGGVFAAHWSPRNRARFIFVLRIFPFAAALLFVCAFLLPSYFLFEPAASDETVSLKLALLAGLSAVGTITAFYRVFGTFWRTKRLIKDWSRRSVPIAVAGAKFPVYRLIHPFPVIAVVGFFRPRIFVAAQIFDVLNADELAAALAHENGHLAARDNLKRWLLRVCRDLLIFPIGKTLDRIWAETAETAADEYVAADGGSRSALDLAAALIKIARIVPPETSPAMPLGAFLIQPPCADITGRVRRLVEITTVENNPPKPSAHHKFRFRLGFAIASLPIIWLAANDDFLYAIHNVLEKVVAFLQ